MITKITVTGVQDTVAYFNRLATQMQPRVVEPHQKEYTNALKTAMVNRMHRSSGRMVKSTRIVKVINGYAVLVDVPYANQEDTRPGNKVSKRGTGTGTPHTFTEPSIKEVDKNQFDIFLFRFTAFLQGA
jgi:hypothetical protein